MADYKAPLITVDGTYPIVYVHKPRNATEWVATINAYGTFGGGTLSYSISTDGGTTKTQMKDLTGTAYSTTTADAINVILGVPSNNVAARQTILYAVLSGSTSPSLSIDVLDNT